MLSGMNRMSIKTPKKKTEYQMKYKAILSAIVGVVGLLFAAAGPASALPGSAAFATAGDQQVSVIEVSKRGKRGYHRRGGYRKGYRRGYKRSYSRGYKRGYKRSYSRGYKRGYKRSSRRSRRY